MNAPRCHLALAGLLLSVSLAVPAPIADTSPLSPTPGQPKAIGGPRSAPQGTLSTPEPVNGKPSLTNQPLLAIRGGFHIRGSTTAGIPQASFAVQFLDEMNQERHRPALGLPADSDWILYAPNVYEPVMIHNPF